MAGIIVAPKASTLELILLFVTASLLASKRSYDFSSWKWTAYLLFVFIMWLGVSNNWSIASEGGLLNFLRIASIFVGGVIVSASFPNLRYLDYAELSGGLTAGYFLGGGIICFAATFAAMTSSSLWGTYYFDPLTTLNNSAVVIALVSWAVLAIAVKYSVRHAVLGSVLTLILLLFLASSAAAGAFLIGMVVLVMRRFGGRRVGMLISAIAAIFIVLAPQLIKLSDAKIYATPEAQTSISSIPPSARHRLAMWSFAVEKIDEKPWLGWGFGASRYIPQEDRRLAPNMEIMPLHPHNLSLQTRLELGLPGSLILAGLVFAVFYRLATFTDDGWISGLAMAPAVGWLFIANVSYGMWQSWWIALAFLLAIFMKFALARREFSNV